MIKTPRGLGRGLDALLPQVAPADSNAGRSSGSSAVASTAQVNSNPGSAFACALEKIVPCREQPRHHFAGDALEELTQSIREYGVIEPLVVRKVGEDRFEIIAGERRWRAAQKAGLREVMVVVRDVSSTDAFELALIENIQREDLNPIELAEALQRLLEAHHYTQETLAKRVGKDRSTLANALRLLKLPQAVRDLVTQDQLSEGHARALLGAPSDAVMIRLAELCVRSKLSVRQLENEVRAQKSRKGDAEPVKAGGKSPATRDLETRMARKFGVRCQVRDRKGKGELVLPYSSLDELDRLLELLL